jgi:hypothetical protein
MLLEGKNTIVYSGGGAMGAAIARDFAREGATVYLAGRTLANLETVAQDITAAGGRAETADVGSARVAPRRSRGHGGLHGLRPRRSDDRRGRQPELRRNSGLVVDYCRRPMVMPPDYPQVRHHRTGFELERPSD